MSQKFKRIIILCFVDYYLPGFRSGGALRSIANFVDFFGDELDIRIITRDRDFLDTVSYDEVLINDWNRVGKASVFYASKSFLSLLSIAQLIRGVEHDVLYLNSFYSYKFTFLPLLARRLGLAPKQACVIAPRGEFSSGAMSLKARKKSLYLIAAKVMRLFSGLCWQASSDFELLDILRVMRVESSSIYVAPDLPAFAIDPSNLSLQKKSLESTFRLVFLSRIMPKKNLCFLLEALHLVCETIDLAIYGPLEDPVYWKRCQSLISTLPSNISVNYCGELRPSDVLTILSDFDLFVLPTLGENYGHVVFESLTSGTPVLISDQTPWTSSADQSVLALSLCDPEQWAAAIDRYALLTVDERLKRKVQALNYAKEYREKSDVVGHTRQLFQKALQQNML